MMDFRVRLEALAASIEELPALPQAVAELQTVMAREDATAQDVARVAERDPALASRLLRVANSAFYGGVAGPIASVTLAVARIGFREVNRLATTLAVIEAFTKVGRDLDHRRFWKHCLTAGIATREIHSCCTALKIYQEDEAYMAGLLHDVGILVLDQCFPEEWRRVSERIDEEGASAADVETRLLGMDHGEIGAVVLKQWRMPVSIVEAVRHHNHPGQASPIYRPLAQLIHLSEFVCTAMDIGYSGDGTVNGASEGAWHDLGIEIETIPGLIERVTECSQRSDFLLACG